MIIKIVACISDTIANYTVTYDSGRVRKYSHRDKLPKAITDFMKTHTFTKVQYKYWAQYTYIYLNRKEEECI